MKSSKSSAEQKYCTFVNWASKEKQQMRMKVQHHSSIAKVKRVHQLLTQYTSKFIASTLTDASLRRIGRKILDPHARKMTTKGTTPEEITSKPEAATPVEAETGVEVKKDLSIACSTRKTLTIGQGIAPFSWNLKRR
jgi:hypothetical protein